MHILVLPLNPSEISPAELEHKIMLLPEWRRVEALRYRHHLGRLQCAESYLLMCRGLREYYGISVQPTFVRSEGGKPALLEYPEIYFNLSHCKRGLMCALSDAQVGCDIESIQDPLKPDLVHYCCNEEETASVFAAANPALRFTELWTRKEALVKLTGEGLTDDIRAILTSPRASGVSLDTQTCEKEGFAYTVASYQGGLRNFKSSPLNP